MQKCPCNCHKGANIPMQNFLEQKCPSNFKTGAKLSVTLNFFYFLMHHFLSINLVLKYVTDLFISLSGVIMMRQRMMSEKVKTLTIIVIFASVLKFNRQFKKLYFLKIKERDKLIN